MLLSPLNSSISVFTILRVSEKVGIEEFTNAEGETLTQGVGEMAAGGKEALAQLAEDLNQTAGEAGVYTAQGLANGISEAAGQVTDATEGLGDGIKESLTSVLQCGSPSKVTHQYGLWVAQGLGNGILEGQIEPVTNAKNMAQLVGDSVKNNLPKNEIKSAGISVAKGVQYGIIEGQVNTVEQAASMDRLVVASINNNINQSDTYGAGITATQGVRLGLINGQLSPVEQAASVAKLVISAVVNNISRTSTYSAGLNVAYGLGDGIYAGSSYAINAAASMASRALSAAKSRLRINSPSKAFEELGEYSGEGFAGGFKKVDVAREIESSMKDTLMRAAALTQMGNGLSLGVGVTGAVSGSNNNFTFNIYANDVDSGKALVNEVVIKVKRILQHDVQQKSAVW